MNGGIWSGEAGADGLANIAVDYSFNGQNGSHNVDFPIKHGDHGIQVAEAACEAWNNTNPPFRASAIPNGNDRKGTRGQIDFGSSGIIRVGAKNYPADVKWAAP